VAELAGAGREQAAAQLRRLLAQADQPWGLLLFQRCLCGLLADHLADHLAALGGPSLGGPSVGGGAAPAPEWLARELAALERGDAPLPDTRELARRCARVPEHLARTFRRCLGVTPSQYLNRKRLARAAGLLAHGNEKILEVCRLAGFHNLPHFYRLFRDEHGLSPRAYRRRFAVRPPV
jgi:AraC-like DNA-binding protein